MQGASDMYLLFSREMIHSFNQILKLSVIQNKKNHWSVGNRAKILSTFGYSYILAIYTQGPGNVTHGSAVF